MSRSTSPTSPDRTSSKFLAASDLFLPLRTLRDHPGESRRRSDNTGYRRCPFSGSCTGRFEHDHPGGLSRPCPPVQYSSRSLRQQRASTPGSVTDSALETSERWATFLLQSES